MGLYGVEFLLGYSKGCNGEAYLNFSKGRYGDAYFRYDLLYIFCSNVALETILLLGYLGVLL